MTPIHRFGGQPVRRTLTLRDPNQAAVPPVKLTRASPSRSPAPRSAAIRHRIGATA